MFVSKNYVSDIYFIVYVVFLTLSRSFQTERVATSIGVAFWVLQATLSTVIKIRIF